MRQFTTLEVLKTPRFYVLYTMFVLMATGGLLVTANAGPIVRAWGLNTTNVEFLWMSMAALTLATTLSPLANGAARVTWGWASDRLGRENTMVLTFVLQAISLLLVVVLGQRSGGWFAFTLVLVYFTWGQIYSLFPAVSADYFGSKNATSNYAVLYTAKGVASIIGAWFGALLFEQFGDWSMRVLRQRGDGVDRRGHGDRAASVDGAGAAAVRRAGRGEIEVHREFGLGRKRPVRAWYAR